MRILKIEIETFGKLTELCLEPAEGITLIEGDNESGKSTLLAFLRFMFYGFPRRSGPEGEERDKRLSWRDRTAAGRLILESGGTRYRINRRAWLRGTAARENLCEELTVLRLCDGEALSLDGKTPGEYFLGLPPELYEGSLCMTQSGADRVCAPGVGEAMGDLLFAGESSLCAEDALAKLGQARRDLQHLKGRGGRIAELEDELSALESAAAHASEDALRLGELRADAARYRARVAEHRAEFARISAAFERAELERTLALFDDKAQAAAEEARCRALLEEERRQQLGDLPDHAFVERVALALRRALHEQANVKALGSEVELLRGIRQDEELLHGAASVEKLGGSAATLKKIEKKKQKKKISGIMGAIFAVFAAGAGAVARLLPAYRFYAAIGAGALLAAAVLCLVLLACAAKGLKRLLSDLGVTGAIKLRTHLEKALREAEIARTNGARLQAAEQELASAQQGLDEANACLTRELTSVGRAELVRDPEAITAFLEEITQKQQIWQSSVSQATISLEKAKSVTETLSRRLDGVDEQALRARCAALPPVTDSDDTLRRKQAFLEQTIAGLEQKCAEAERAESALAATARDPELLGRERASTEERLTAARRKLAAVRMAQEAMESAVEELRRSVTPRLCVETARIFEMLTDGVHGELRLAPDFSVTLEEDGVPRPLSHFSAGCRDAAYLSLRLALLGTLSGETLPLFFDEALARLDDRRAEALLDVIVHYCREGGQCLLFTCHTRESRLLEGTPGVKRFAMPTA